MKNTYNFYDEFDCPSIDTTKLSPAQVVEKICEMTGNVQSCSFLSDE